MNGHYAEIQSEKAIKLAKKTEKRLNETMRILAKLIECLQDEIGHSNTQKILNINNFNTKK